MSAAKWNVRLYHPRSQDRDLFLEQPLAHAPVFRRLWRDVQEAPMKTPEQHLLIAGRSGMGKTSLLLRLAYRVEEPSENTAGLVPLLFNEAEHGIRKLYQLWERSLDLLIEKVPLFASLTEERARLSTRHREDATYERALQQLLDQQLRMGRRKLLLLVDNFDRLLPKFSQAELHRLRKVLQTSAEIRLIASAEAVPQAFYDYQHPLYEFFKVEQLDPLATEATRALLRSLAERSGRPGMGARIAAQGPRIETIRRLSGGVLRNLIALFKLHAEDRNGDSAFADLEQLLDQWSPTYQERVDRLPPAQQEIIAQIALHWDAIQVGEIARGGRLASKVVSAQLQTLVKNRWVEKITTDTKNHLYRLRERFFNLWYLWRNGDAKGRSRLRDLLAFTEAWCASAPPPNPSDPHAPQRAHTLLAEALSLAPLQAKPEPRPLPSPPPQRASLARRELQGLLQRRAYRQALPLLLQQRDQNQLLLGQIYADDLRDYARAERCLRAATKTAAPEAHNQLGILYQYRLQRPREAEQQFLRAAEYRHPRAWYNLGLLYQVAQRDYPRAVEYFQRAHEAGDREAGWNLAELYIHRLEEPQRAVPLYRAAAEEGQLDAWRSLGSLYHRYLRRPTEATHCFKRVLDHYRIYGLTLDERRAGGDLDTTLYLSLFYLMARGEWDALRSFWDSIESRQGIDRLKPVYYAGLALQKERFGREYQRMGGELVETVTEILETIAALRT